MAEKTYIVSYEISQEQLANDTRTAVDIREQLRDRIMSYGVWARITDDCWAIVTNDQVASVRDRLLEVMRRGHDRLMVIQSANVGAWSNTLCRSDWLQANL